MSLPLKLVLHGLTGLVLGVALAVIAMVTTIALAVATNARASIPGVFTAWMEQYEGAPSLVFVPNELGLGIAVALVAVLYTAIAVFVSGAASRRTT